MKLRKVEILGFKSFRTKVGVEIGEGVTAVVGPNGCGKSNIVDAVRWAMGSQSPRDLRGRSMEDIIFGGSENHRPMGFAEVSLTFENNPEVSALPLEWRDQDTIKVTRRLFRNGDSDYEINGARARLRDIHNVFAGTGVSSRDAYSIIEQGRIGFVVAARPEERRVIIEEAAGITRYKNQRKLAERRLRRTEDNLLRIGDVVREVVAQSARLERQAQRAIAARELRAELQDIQMVLHADVLRKTAKDYDDALKEFRLSEEKSQASQVEIAAAETHYEALRLQVQTYERAANDAAEAAYQTRARVDLLEASIEHRAREKTLNAQRQQETTLRLKNDEENEAALHQELRALEDASQRDTADDDGLEERLQETQEQSDLLRQQVTELSGRMQESQEALNAHERTIARASTRVDALRADLRTLAAREKEAKEVREETQEQADALRELAQQERDTLEGTEMLVEDNRLQLQELLQAEKRQREALEDAQESLQKIQHARREADAALQSIRHILSTGVGLADGARRVLQEADAQSVSGVLGPLAARLQADAGTEAQLATILGVWMDAILVNTRSTALKLLSIARESGHAVAVLCLEDPIEGAITPWLRAVAPIPQSIAEQIANTARKEALDADVREPSVDAKRWWTDGTGRYMFRADAMAAEQLLKNQRERDILADRLERLEEDEVDAEDALIESRELLETTQERRQEQQERTEILEDTVRRARLDLEEHLSRAQHAERHLRRLEKEHEEAQERIENVRKDIAQSQQASQEAERARDGLIQEVQTLKDALTQREAEREDVEERLTVLKIEQARREADRQHLQEQRKRLRREIETVEQRILDAKKILIQCAQDAEELDAKAHKEAQELEAQKEERISRDQAADRAKTAFEEARVQAREQEIRLSDLRRVHSSVSKTKQEHMLRVERTRNERARAVEDTAVFECSPEALLERVGDRQATPELHDAAASLRRRLDALGAVNPAAEEEYAASIQRQEFLLEQQTDLETALQDLRDAIEKMDETCRVLFADTFERVNAGFQEMFPRLFRGGKARLELTDPSDLLETGVDIVAQPPGKRLQNLSLLSGGEKALTAAALIFAIFELRPSPICILDEVDAPLDEANVGRFAEMVREISARSQFLVITHNTRTMEVADTLYGVTMQEPGVSKIVGVNLKGVQDVMASTSA